MSGIEEEIIRILSQQADQKKKIRPQNRSSYGSNGKILLVMNRQPKTFSEKETVGKVVDSVKNMEINKLPKGTRITGNVINRETNEISEYAAEHGKYVYISFYFYEASEPVNCAKKIK